MNSSGSNREKELFDCILDDLNEQNDGQVYRIKFSETFIANHREELVTGATVCIPHAIILNNPNEIIYNPIYNISIVRAPKRILAPTSGTSLALSVRVVSSRDGSQPIADMDDLQGRIFGEGPRPEKVNLSSQFEGCSQGNLKIVPAEGEVCREEEVIEYKAVYTELTALVWLHVLATLECSQWSSLH